MAQEMWFERATGRESVKNFGNCWSNPKTRLAAFDFHFLSLFGGKVLSATYIFEDCRRILSELRGIMKCMGGRTGTNLHIIHTRTYFESCTVTTKNDVELLTCRYH